MATVAGGYRINGAVLINNTVTRSSSIGTTTGVWYTAPSNGFAILTVAVLEANCSVASGVATGSANIYVNGTVVLANKAIGSTGSTYFGGNVQATTLTGPSGFVIYLGPGQTLDYNLNIGTAAVGTLNVNCRVFGVEYVNV
jgi:hypothetical protein